MPATRKIMGIGRNAVTKIITTSSALADLTDVSFSSLQRGNVLYYNGSKWKNLAPGTANQVLTTQGTGADPTWTNKTSATGIVGGLNTMVQFNDGGSNFGGTPNFLYFKDTANLTISGSAGYSVSMYGSGSSQSASGIDIWDYDKNQVLEIGYNNLANESYIWAKQTSNNIKIGTNATKRMEIAASDGKIYTTNDFHVSGTLTAGTATLMGTDTIWNAKGDLAAATASNTASRLSIGADNKVLTADSTATHGMEWKTTPAVADVGTLRLAVGSGSSGGNATRLVSSPFLLDPVGGEYRDGNVIMSDKYEGVVSSAGLGRLTLITETGSVPLYVGASGTAATIARFGTMTNHTGTIHFKHHNDEIGEIVLTSGTTTMGAVGDDHIFRMNAKGLNFENDELSAADVGSGLKLWASSSNGLYWRDGLLVNAKAGLTNGYLPYVTGAALGGVANSSVYHDSAGKVGINTNSPNRQLDVRGTTLLSGNLGVTGTTEISSTLTVKSDITGTGTATLTTGTYPNIKLDPANGTAYIHLQDTSRTATTAGKQPELLLRQNQIDTGTHKANFPTIRWQKAGPVAADASYTNLGYRMYVSGETGAGTINAPQAFIWDYNADILDPLNYVELLRLGTDGALKINRAYTMPTAAPAANGYIITGAADGTTAWVANTGGGGGSNYWSLTGNDIYYTSGNVGINADHPSQKLHVSGNVLFGTAAGAGATGYDHIYIGDTTKSIAGYGNRLDFYVSSNPRAHIDASTFYSATSGGPSLDLTPGPGGTANYGFVGDTDTGMTRSAANTLHLLTAGVSGMTMDSSQNVGIGTTSPGSALDVRGNIQTTGKIYLSGTNLGGSISRVDTNEVELSAGTTEQMRLGVSNSYLKGTNWIFNGGGYFRVNGTKQLQFGDDEHYIYSDGTDLITKTTNTTGQGIVTDAFEDITFKINGTSHMTILSGGNVGINTTGPSYPLHVVQGSGDTYGMYLFNSASRGIYFGDTSNDGSGYGKIGGVGGSLFLGPTQIYTSFIPTGDTDAYLGQANRRWSYSHFRYGQFGYSSGQDENTSAGGYVLAVSGNSDRHPFMVKAFEETTPNFIVASGGTVGLNTTTPTAQLHIDYSNEAHNGKKALHISSGSTTAFVVSGGSAQVGIGTGSPTTGAMLDVSGGALYVNNNLGFDTSAKLQVDGRIKIKSGDIEMPGMAIYGAVLRDTGTYTDTEFQSNDGTHWTWDIDGSEVMRLDQTGLGVGTSSPHAMLEVSGQSTAPAKLLLHVTSGTRSMVQVSGQRIGFGPTGTNNGAMVHIDNTHIGSGYALRTLGGGIDIAGAQALSWGSGDQRIYSTMGGGVRSMEMSIYDFADEWYAMTIQGGTGSAAQHRIGINTRSPSSGSNNAILDVSGSQRLYGSLELVNGAVTESDDTTNSMWASGTTLMWHDKEVYTNTPGTSEITGGGADTYISYFTSANNITGTTDFVRGSSGGIGIGDHNINTRQSEGLTISGTRIQDDGRDASNTTVTSLSVPLMGSGAYFLASIGNVDSNVGANRGTGFEPAYLTVGPTSGVLPKQNFMAGGRAVSLVLAGTSGYHTEENPWGYGNFGSLLFHGSTGWTGYARRWLMSNAWRNSGAGDMGLAFACAAGSGGVDPTISGSTPSVVMSTDYNYGGRTDGQGGLLVGNTTHIANGRLTVKAAAYSSAEEGWPQMTLAYDGSNYFTFRTDSSGILSISGATAVTVPPFQVLPGGGVHIDRYTRLMRNTSTNGLYVTDSGGNPVKVGTASGTNGGFSPNNSIAGSNGILSTIYRDNSRMRYDSPDAHHFVGDMVVSGNVGIGTDEPRGYLEVRSSADDDPTIRLTNSRAGTSGSLVLQHRGSSVKIKAENDQPMGFVMGSTEVMTINSDDTVGIGTTGPDAKLEVLSTTEQLRLTHTDASKYTTFTQGANDFTIKNEGSGDDIIINPNDKVQLHANGINYATTADTPYLYIQPTGTDGSTGANIFNLTAGQNITLDAKADTVIKTDGTSIGTFTSAGLGIGTTSPDAKLELLSTTEQLRLTHTDASKYNAFHTDDAGGLSIYSNGTARANRKVFISGNSIIMGQYAGYDLTHNQTGEHVIIGDRAGFELTGAETHGRHTIVGAQAVYTMTGGADSNYITAIGAYCAYGANTTKGFTALGPFAGYYLSGSGDGPLLLGNGAGKGTAFAAWGTVNGVSMNEDVLIGNGGVAEYAETLSYNTIVGSRAAGFMRIGSQNVAVGRFAMRNASGTAGTTGNVAIGQSAGAGIGQLGSADYNIAIGYETQEKGIIGDKNIAIGYKVGIDGQVTDSSILRIGNAAGDYSYIKGDMANDNFWIGATTPKFTLSGGNVGIGTGFTDISHKLHVEGSAYINGTLTATAKSFDIPHPDKKGMRLIHGSLEGPEHGVYVRGTAKGHGDTTIELPDYWETLVGDDYTLQLTSYNSSNVYIVDKDKTSFTVGSNSLNYKFDYFVIGSREEIEVEIDG